MRTKSNNNTVIEIVGSLVVLFIFWAIATLATPNITDGYEYVHNCDYKTISLNTAIYTKNSLGTARIIKGNVFTFFTDPLTMTDVDGNVLGYAGDTYHLIGQDDHGIYLDDVHAFDVRGKFTWFGNEYEVYDHEGTKIASAEFNMFDTYGKLVGIDGTLIAEYSSGFFRNDYEVYVHDDELINEDSLFMIFASYVSDQKADSRSSSSSSSRSSK